MAGSFRPINDRDSLSLCARAPHSGATATHHDVARSNDKAVTDLLDHVAAELAAEYVRLMEAAAEADTKQVPSSPPDQKRGSR